MRRSWEVSHEAARGEEGPDRYEQERTVGKELRKELERSPAPKSPEGRAARPGAGARQAAARGSGSALLRCVGTGGSAEGLADVLARRGGRQGLAPPS